MAIICKMASFHSECPKGSKMIEFPLQNRVIWLDKVDEK